MAVELATSVSPCPLPWPSRGLEQPQEYLRTNPDPETLRKGHLPLSRTSPEVDPSLYPRRYRKNLHEPPNSAGKTDIDVLFA